jgi:hypothetical protein
MEPMERDDPIPVRTICDTPEAISDALDGLSGWPESVVVIERSGQPMGALISMNDLQLFQRLLFDREMEQDLAALAEADKERGEAIPLEQLMEQFGITASS